MDNLITESSKNNVEGLQAAPEEAPVVKESFDPVKYFKEKMTMMTTGRQDYDRNCSRNVFFYLGKQWITYDKGKRYWTDSNLPKWMPRPVTNKFAASVDTAQSILNEVQPTILFTPAQDNSKALGASEVASAIVDICNEEMDKTKKDNIAKFWAIVAGDAFLIPKYSLSPLNGTIKVPKLKCSSCGYVGKASEFPDNVCPQCGQKDVSTTALDENGNEIVDEYPKGKFDLEVCGPLQIYADLECENIEESAFVFKAKSYTYEQLKAAYPDVPMQEEEFTGSTNELPMQYMQTIAYTTNATQPDITSTSPSNKKRMTVYECFVKPTEEYPEGWYFIIANDRILEGPMPLPYHDDNGKPFINIIHIKAKTVGGRLLSKSPVDDLVTKQIQRNKLEMFIEVSQSRMANSSWLIPLSSGIKKVTGEPGEKIFYNDSTTLGAKPERIPGVEITQSTFRYMNIIDKDFEEIGATTDVLKGQAPQNVPTLGALELLKERGLSRFDGLTSSWEEATVKLARMQLWIWKEYATEARTKRIMESDGNWKFREFTKASLTGNIDVRAEKGSSTPRSEAYKQTITGQMLDKQLIDVTDPFTKLEVFKLFHNENLISTLKEDINDAVREQEDFLAYGEVKLRLRPAIDNNEIHFRAHQKFAKSEKFMALPRGMQQQFYEHIQNTLMVIRQGSLENQQQNQALSQASPSGAPIGQPVSTAQEMAQKEQGLH